MMIAQIFLFLTTANSIEFNYFEESTTIMQQSVNEWSEYLRGYKNCFPLQDRQREYFFVANSKVHLKACSPADVYELLCTKFKKTVFYKNTAPIEITPNVIHLIGYRNPPIKCSVVHGKIPHTEAVWSHVDGLRLFKIRDNQLIQEMDYNMMGQGTYACNINTSEKYDIPFIRTFYLYPEPRIKLSRDRKSLIIEPKGQFEGLKTTIRFWQESEVLCFNAKENKIVSTCKEFKTQTFYRVTMEDFEINGVLSFHPSELNYNVFPDKDSGYYAVEVIPDISFILLGAPWITIKCMFTNLSHSETVISWSHISGFEIFHIRRNTLFQVYHLLYGFRSTYSCLYQNKVMHRREFIVINNARLIFEPDPGESPINFSITSYACVLENSEFLRSVIKVKVFRSSTIQPFTVEGNQLRLTIPYSGRWLVECRLPYTPDDFVMTKVFKIVYTPKYMITPNNLRFINSEMEDIVCHVEPVGFSRFCEIRWEFNSGDRTHRVDKTEPWRLKPLKILEGKSRYTCKVRCSVSANIETVRITVYASVHTIVMAYSHVQITNISFTLGCGMLPKISDLNSINWESIEYHPFSTNQSNGTTSEFSGLYWKLKYVKPVILKVRCVFKNITAIWTYIYVQDPPELALSNPSNINYIVEHDNIVECITLLKPGYVAYMGVIRWVNENNASEVNINGHRLFFTQPTENFRKINLTCHFQIQKYHTQKLFTFNILSIESISLGSAGANNLKLIPGDKCDDVCESDNSILNAMPTFKSWWSDPIIQSIEASNFQLAIKGNKVTCPSEKVTGYLCYTLTCNGEIRSKLLPPKNLTRCYIDDGKTDIQSIITVIPPGGTILCLSAAKLKSKLVFHWSAKNVTTNYSRITGAGYLGVIPLTYANQNITVRCTNYLVGNGISAILDDATVDIQVDSQIEIILQSRSSINLLINETLTCISPTSNTSYLKITAPWEFTSNGFFLTNARKIKVPKCIRQTVYPISCTVHKNSKIITKWHHLTAFTKILDAKVYLSHSSVSPNEYMRCYTHLFPTIKLVYTIKSLELDGRLSHFCPYRVPKTLNMFYFDPVCPFGERIVECTISLAESPNKNITAIFVVNLIVSDYSPALFSKPVYSQIFIPVIVFLGCLWCLILLCSAFTVSLQIGNRQLSRLAVLQFMHVYKLGGTRKFKRNECLPCMYISRKEISGDRINALGLCILRYEWMLDKGEQWFLLWMLKKRDIQQKIITVFRTLTYDRGWMEMIKIYNRSTYVHSKLIRQTAMYDLRTSELVKKRINKLLTQRPKKY